MSDADIIIVGSGMGGATLAAGLAATGLRILADGFPTQSSFFFFHYLEPYWYGIRRRLTIYLLLEKVYDFRTAFT